MKKSLLSLMALVGATIIMSGCTGGGGSDDGQTATASYYLKDSNMEPVSDIEYDCGTYAGVTGVDGSYQYEAQRNVCYLTLIGIDDTLYIYNENGPVNGLNYKCSSGLEGVTDANGLVDYIGSEQCTTWVEYN